MPTPSATKTYHKTTYPSISPTRPQLSARGKTILITGGGTGIGAATALSYAKAGAKLIALLGRRADPLLETKSRIEFEYPEVFVLVIPTDITSLPAVTAAFSQVASKADDGKIDILIANAAVIGIQGLIPTLSPAQLMSGISTNLSGTLNLVCTFLIYSSPGGTIIEINSAAAHLNVGPKFASYNTSKAATARFLNTLSHERPDLNIFSVQPGAIETDMSRESGYVPKKEGEEWVFDESQAGGGLMTYDDVSLPADFCVWLGSEEARFLRGKYLWANWDVDELMERKEEVEGSNLLELGLIGWPFE